MSLMPLLLVFVLTQISAPCFANQDYKSGLILSLENQDLVKQERGLFVDVPVDYKNPSKGRTQIYVHFYSSYNPKLPTLLYFPGGPGFSSRDETDIRPGIFSTAREINVLEFDQRGIGFSRPASKEQWLNPDFYSSENTARDAEEIRKFLGINSLFVYGMSYGTVPATIYGHLFPRSTKSIVLEGTIFRGVGGHFNRTVPRVIQRYFDSLSVELKQKIMAVSLEPDVGRRWFPSFVTAVYAFYGVDFLPYYTPDLEKLAALPVKEFKQGLLKKGYLEESGHTRASLSHLNKKETVVRDILLIKEFEVAELSNTELRLENGKVTWESDLGTIHFYRERSRVYNIDLAKQKPYIASDYPLSVPVYYLHGSLDSTAVVSGVLSHWKYAARNNASLALFLGKDHDILEAPKEGEEHFSNLVLQRALNSEPLYREDAKRTNCIKLLLKTAL